MTIASSWRAARFRQNEALRAFAAGLPGPVGLHCECADPRCRELVLVDAAEVYAVRANPLRIVLAIGHQTNQERIVLEYDRYVIAELREQAPA